MLRKKAATPTPTDLEIFGTKIIANSITDAELDIFFKKFNNAGGQELNTIVSGFMKYMDIAQQYRLCVRLIPLEAKYNGLDRFLRNKSVASLCINAFINKLGFTDRLFRKFIGCQAVYDFLDDAPEIPLPVCSLFQLAQAQFPNMTEEDKAKLSPNVIFFLITTPIVCAAMQIADNAEVIKHTTNIKNLTANTKSSLYCRFERGIFKQINDCPAAFAMPIQKSEREIENDCMRLINEARDLSSRDLNVLISWPTVFNHVRITPETEDKIQETRCHNMLNWYYTNLNPKNLSALDRTVGDTVSMMDAITRNHPNWLNATLINLVSGIYMKAKSILISAKSDDHRLKLLELELTLLLNTLPSVKASKEERQFDKLNRKK